ncbi:MAG: hypothetical protein AAF328_10515, partial [Planctomycetota bacterium]
MAFPVQKMLALGAGATGVAVSGAVCGPMGAAMAGVASGVLGNLLSSLLEPGVVAGDEPSPESLIRNHDLRRLVGLAIRDTLLLHNDNNQDELLRTTAAQLAAGAEEFWMSEAAAADTSLDPLNEAGSADLLLTPGLEFDHLNALDVPTWRDFLDGLAQATAATLSESARDDFANRLHQRLPGMLRAKAKQDFTGDTEADGLGYASLQLYTLSKLAAGVEELLEAPRKTQAAQHELLDALRGVHSQLPGAVDRHERRLKPRERQVMSGVLNELRQLRPLLNKRFDALGRAVAAEGQQTRGEVRGADRKVVYVLAAVAVLAIGGVIAWSTLHGGERATQDAVATAQAESEQRDAQTQDALAAFDAQLKAIARRQQQQLQANPDQAPEISEEDRATLEAIKQRGDVLQRATAAALSREFDEADRLLDEIDEAAITAEPFRYYTARGDRWYFAKEYDRAIEPYETALRLRPEDFEANQNVIAAHTFARLGDIAAHRQRAIDLSTATLQRVEAGSLDWAITQNNLGNAWQTLPTGDRSGNLGKAIDAYEAALEVTTRTAHPADWARTQNNLGNAWQTLPTGDRSENLGKAIDAYEAALEVTTRTAHPVEWARTQNNLGTAWADLPTGDRSANLGK